MAESTLRFPMGHRSSGRIHRFPGKPESTGVMIFGFLEENEESPESSYNSGADSFNSEDLVDDDEEDENASNAEANKAFWESQELLLEATLCRSSSIESKIRQATKDALRELNKKSSGCTCGRPAAGGCRSCLQRELSGRLQAAGYNCSICKSKWKSSPDMPSGEHTYLEVIHDSSSKKRETRVIIELSFRAEFEMARASDEYNGLVCRLPEVFIGKAERLRSLVKILCGAGKKCMKEKRMHMAPWRKHKYMQAKWLGKREPIQTVMPILPNLRLDRMPKHRASLLTFDLLENLTTLHCTAVRVV
ncbi:uncharacterized protein LOC127792297 [Diospyros lotus]|uniref:uncharacterized protein LOC127792297 n=1 Tax=Diospyros lotus TaxID=55363 RepID=UPI002258E8EA|nr:uncharacterized protein LOC127792297 [Diospyros lotus]